MKMQYELKYKMYAENAILIEWPSEIDEFMLNDLLNYKNKVEKFYVKEIVEIILSYNSLLIYYMSTIKDVYGEVLALKKLYVDGFDGVELKNRLWKIPVCYSEVLAPDLESFKMAKSLSLDEVIGLHTTPLYTVFFLGFLPGFMYLGGLSSQLYLDRKKTPSLYVEKGSVAIGGNQTGIYPQDSPGGWHVIGKTPLSFFDVNAKDMCFISPGDKIQFISISEKKYNDIRLLIENNLYIPESKML